ncbi:MAG: hypothetical protein AB7J19_03630 [Beijerinckiaceae bacterium]
MSNKRLVCHLPVRLTMDDYTRLTAVAAKFDVPLSEIAREAIARLLVAEMDVAGPVRDSAPLPASPCMEARA